MPAKILVVDDRPTNRQFLSTLLGYGGHRLLEAGDGAEALKIVRAEHPDLVISDILMPTMDGFEFAKSVRADPAIAGTKIVFYTATYRAQEAKLLATACGVSTVIAKPADPQRVLDVVNEQLGIPATRSIPRQEKKTSAAPKETVEGGDLSRLGVQLTDYVNDLRGLKAQLDGLVERGLELEKERERLRGISSKFAQNLSQLHATSAQLYALVELGMDMASERDPQRLLQVFTAAARRILGARGAVTLVLEPNENQAKHVASDGLEPVAAQAMQAIGLKDGLVGRVFADRKLVLAAAEPGKPGLEGLPAGHPAARSFLGVAIGSSSRCHGVAFFTDKRGGASDFDEDDWRIAQALAAQLSLTYENFELFDTLQRHSTKLQVEIEERKLADERVKRLNRVYAVLSGINTLIVRIRDREALFREACEIAFNEGQFSVAWIGICEPSSGEVKPVAWRGLDDRSVESIHAAVRGATSAGGGVAGLAIRAGRPVIANDSEHDARVLIAAETLVLGSRSLVALPLLVGGKVAGVLVLHAREKNFFDAEEMKLLEELAGDVAFALDTIEKRDRLDYLAFYDPLTGLPNRALFDDRLGELIRAAGKSGRGLALAKFDIERLRVVNESLGRHVGDELLKQVAARLVNAAGASAVARVTSDHFAVVLESVEGSAGVERRVDEISRACFETPFSTAGSELRLAAKAGIVLFPGDGADAETLLRNAEAALRKAKELGEHHLFYTAELTGRSEQSLTMENKLRQALEKEEFVLHYQPKVDLESRRILGVEALIRWQNPELGLVPPGKFIPLLEETGLILPVGAWALKRAALDHRRWAEQKLAAPRVAVNVSAIQLRQRDFVKSVEQAIAAGVSPTGIDLEITESLIMTDIQGNIEKLNAVRELGMSIAIDDFGTGYSSLGYLARLPVQALKIDRSFVVTMLGDANAMTLVQTMISLAHSLRLEVVAEGVESEEQAKMLRLLRCDEMQGYLYSKPVPFEQLTALLRRELESPAAPAHSVRV